ncbi:hypothetical protein NQ176_g5517 [Zarea fungicola]|uniref:Uncharacterized protein n=1 Tax=Zarea fungicola TaxID=93591 RepID=A0ACC1N9Z0_9HYPO|nr:hypothetical protein NQ176_g5517 [Lecanicillium fungicola]
MAEVLGVVSAATQLASLCGSILSLLKKIKSWPSTLQSYNIQLRDISLLSISIAHNPLLQTLEIESLTQSLLALISKANLSSLLQRHKVFRGLYLLFKEQDLLDTLTAVERQKLSLCLSIEQIQSVALYEIRTDIQSMSFEKQNIGKKRTDVNKSSEQTQLVMADSKPERCPEGSDTTIVNFSDPLKSFNDQRLVKRDTCPMKLQGIIENVQYEGNGLQRVGATYLTPSSCLADSSNTTQISNIEYRGNGKQDVGTSIRSMETSPAGFDIGQLLGQVRGVRKWDSDGEVAISNSGTAKSTSSQFVGVSYTVITKEQYEKEARGE